MARCPDCNSSGDLFGLAGDGKCSRCHGSGEKLLAGINRRGVPSFGCDDCDGTGSCQTCNGTGEVADSSDNGDQTNDSTDYETKTNKDNSYDSSGSSYSGGGGCYSGGGSSNGLDCISGTVAVIVLGIIITIAAYVVADFSNYQKRMRIEGQKNLQIQQRQQDLAPLRENSKIPTQIIGSYPCVNKFMIVSERNPRADGEAILTDTDVSYIHVFDHDPYSDRPDSARTIFTFENIVGIKKVDSDNGTFGVYFDLKKNIMIWHGDYVYGIVFNDPVIRDAFYNKLTEAKAAWNSKHSELL